MTPAEAKAAYEAKKGQTAKLVGKLSGRSCTGVCAGWMTCGDEVSSEGYLLFSVTTGAHWDVYSVAALNGGDWGEPPELEWHVDPGFEEVDAASSHGWEIRWDADLTGGC
jgi:hypothetical protein